MSNRNAYRTQTLTAEEVKQLTMGSSNPAPRASIAIPPRQPPDVAIGAGPRKPTLTEIFNWAASGMQFDNSGPGVAWKGRIELLERQRSQLRHTYEMTPLGSVRRSWDPERERSISREIKRITASLKRREGLSSTFRTSAQRPSVTRRFNRTVSQGMSF